DSVVEGRPGDVPAGDLADERGRNRRQQPDDGTIKRVRHAAADSSWRVLAALGRRWQARPERTVFEYGREEPRAIQRRQAPRRPARRAAGRPVPSGLAHKALAGG